MEHIISLGSSCDGANQLKRRGKNNKTFFSISYGISKEV